MTVPAPIRRDGDRRLRAAPAGRPACAGRSAVCWPPPRNKHIL